MPPARHHSRFPRLHLVVSALGIAVIGLLAAGAHSPELHAWFHQSEHRCHHTNDPAPGPVSTSTDRCAIALFAQGFCELALVAFAHPAPVEATPAQHPRPAPPDLSTPRHLHPPAHAPPASDTQSIS